MCTLVPGKQNSERLIVKEIKSDVYLIAKENKGSINQKGAIIKNV